MPDEYTVALVTYCDILGFKNLVREKSALELRAILETLRAETKPDEDIGKAQRLHFFNFSDLILRIFDALSEFNREIRPGILFYEVLDLVHAQARLIERDVLIRGALTIGEIATSEGMVFGPALVKAYEMEASSAIYPRIVIDPIVLQTFVETNALRKIEATLEHDSKELLQLIRQDVDGLYFVDYLRAIRSEDTEERYLVFLRKHREMIERRLNGLDAIGVASKLGWLASYHNQTVARGFADEELRRSLSIELHGKGPFFDPSAGGRGLT
jgi:hypothetical protein